MYGKVMSIPDSLMMDYFELLTDVDDEMLTEYRRLLSDESRNPMEIKKFLAWEIVRQFHGAEAAEQAHAHFEKVVQRKEVPDEIEEYPVSFSLLRERLIERAPSALAHLAGKKVDIIGKDDTLNFAVRAIDTDEKIYIMFHVGEFLHLSGLVESRAEAKRLVAQGAVYLADPSTEAFQRIEAFDDTRPISDGSVFKIGKRRWVRIVNTDAKR